MPIRREEFRIKPIDTENDVAIGVTLPFSTKKGGLFALSYTTEDQAISNLKSLVLTKRGERPMQPTFGVGLYQRLFEQKTSDSNFILQRELRNDINFWLPYIIVDDIIVQDYTDTIASMSEHGIQIIINFRVSETGANQTLTFNATQDGVTLEG